MEGYCQGATCGVVLTANGYCCSDTSAQPGAKYETRGLNAVKIIRRARGLIPCKLRDMWSSELEWRLFWAGAPYDEVLTDQVLWASESKWVAAVFCLGSNPIFPFDTYEMYRNRYMIYFE